MIENIYCERSLGVVRSIYFRVARPGIGNSRQTLVAAVAIAQRYRSPPNKLLLLASRYTQLTICAPIF